MVRLAEQLAGLFKQRQLDDLEAGGLGLGLGFGSGGGGGGRADAEARALRVAAKEQARWGGAGWGLWGGEG